MNEKALGSAQTFAMPFGRYKLEDGHRRSGFDMGAFATLRTNKRTNGGTHGHPFAENVGWRRHKNTNHCTSTAADMPIQCKAQQSVCGGTYD